MFIEIDNTDMNAHEIDALIKNTRDANGGVLSPEFAMEILSKSNHFANVKKLVKIIKEKCVDDNGCLISDKVLPYKEFVLSCVDGREMSEFALKDLQEMADVCGVRSEFDELDKKEKVYSKKDCQIAIVSSIEELDAALKTDKLIFANIYTSGSTNTIAYKDFSRVRRFKVLSNRPISLIEIKNLPPEMDFSNCDFVDIRDSDFARVNSFSVKKESCVKVVKCKNIKGDWDFSNVFELYINDSDFSNAQELKLANTSFAYRTTLPEVVNVCRCCDFYVDENVNYEHVKTCILKKGSSGEKAVLDAFYGRGIKLMYENNKVQSKNSQEEEDVSKKKSSSGFFGRLFGRGIND
jgi:hypothetical protein